MKQEYMSAVPMFGDMMENVGGKGEEEVKMDAKYWVFPHILVAVSSFLQRMRPKN